MSRVNLVLACIVIANFALLLNFPERKGTWGRRPDDTNVVYKIPAKVGKARNGKDIDYEKVVEKYAESLSDADCVKWLNLLLGPIGISGCRKEVGNFVHMGNVPFQKVSGA